MSNRKWRRHPEEDLAVDDLLDAAGQAFAEFGVAKATMIDIARIAGCSRATLYRYFPNQDALHMAFVHRATQRITTQMVDDRAAGASDSITERIISGIAQVRSDPLLSIWFEPENMAVPIKVSQNSDMLQALSAGAIDETNSTEAEREEIEMRGAWLLRSVVSLLAMPGENEESERAMIEKFIVPVLENELDEVR